MTYYIIGGILLSIILFLLIQYYGLKKSLKNKDRELKSLQRETKKQIHRQQDYITVLSQELRTPLYGIMGLTNLIAEEYPELKDDKKLKSLKFSGDYLLNLINNVLHINYLDVEGIKSQNNLFNLQEVTQNLVNSFSYATDNSDNTLHYDFDPEINPMVIGDASILSQILMNLISNALRFTKNGDVYFSVHLIKSKHNSNNISFKVKHNGDDISSEDQKSIYQEFINIESAKKSYLGTGINSRIVKGLVNVINGDIIIQKNAQEGSEYALVLDLQVQDDKNDNIEDHNNSNEANTNTKRKALIVDDNKLNLLVADKILSKEHFECTTIDNGFDAIELVRENRYDVILMDINMPKLNGIGTTKRIREFNLKTPVIALTAVDITQLNRQIIHAGLNDYILKPYTKNHLLEIINKHLENPILNQ